MGKISVNNKEKKRNNEKSETKKKKLTVSFFSWYLNEVCQVGGDELFLTFLCNPIGPAGLDYIIHAMSCPPPNLHGQAL
jgi:hypothetical protein